MYNTQNHRNDPTYRSIWTELRDGRTITVRWTTEEEMRTRTADPKNGIVDIILVPDGNRTLEMLRWEQH